MRHKKNIIIISLTVVFLSLVFLTLSLLQHKDRFEVGKKVNMKIQIAAVNNEKRQNISLNINHDGERTNVTTGDGKEVYICNNILSYGKDKTIFSYKADTSYSDIIDIMTNLSVYDKIEELSNIASYTALLNKDTINKLLKSLYINSEVEKSQIISFMTEDNHIRNINISLENTSNFRKITIMIELNELESSFTVDNYLETGLKDHVLAYTKREDTESNPLEIK